ncbi:DNA-binding response regulator [Sporanaerobium hydrogeniformans]|uniref:DNA-binding response regulator n=1 Tax=Sporanaerobium hydrogeniformans TaxID=3072179 RepID=A0AC61DDX0_9FIRM|nr:response regulator [Sporanaerobium hydrogeniformans]PHV70817.1 DNA-binding response regulator [Sporanaerobium hydrogeniformans]
MKVLIIDDEYYFREALKVSFPWEECDLIVCGEAKNGIEGLERVRTLNPDIILADINMPLMDGLEFVQRVKEINHNIKIIIISGYSEFEYAKQALTLGVHNYILKPVSNEELYNALQDTIKLIHKERKIKVEMHELKKSVSKNLPVLKGQFLNELIKGNDFLSNKVILDKIKNLGVNLLLGIYIVAVLEIDSEDYSDWSYHEKHLWNYGVINIVEELLGNDFVYETCIDSGDRICILLSFEAVEDFKAEKLNRTFENILDAVKTYLQFTITIGVGNYCKEVKDIAISYNEALYALRNKLILGKNLIIHHQSVSEIGFIGHFFQAEHRMQLLANMRLGSLEDVKQIIEYLFEEVKEKNIEPELLLVIAVEMVTPCLEFVAENNMKFDLVSHTYFKNLFENIKSKKTIEDIKKYIIEIYSTIIEYVNQNKSAKSSKTVEAVVNYIAENYSNCDLTIDLISKAVYMNYTYLCFLFKKQMDMTLNEYITKYRMNKAIELMERGNVGVTEVAYAIGFSNVNYFGKCFKKEFGMTPSRYITSKTSNNK